MPHSEEGLAEKVERAPEVRGGPWGQGSRPGAPGISLRTSIRGTSGTSASGVWATKDPSSSPPSKPSSISAWTAPPPPRPHCPPAAQQPWQSPGLDLPLSSLPSTWSPLGLLLSASLWGVSSSVWWVSWTWRDTDSLSSLQKFFKVPFSDQKVSIQDQSV